MPTLSDIRVAIADAVGTIDGLRAAPLVTDKVNAPQATVWRKGLSYDDVQSDPDLVTYLFGVTVYCARTNEKAAQEFLDELAEPTGDRSFKAVVEADTELAALVDWVIVKQVDEVTVITIGTVDYVTEVFTVEIGVSD